MLIVTEWGSAVTWIHRRGDVLEPSIRLPAIGSGVTTALAAARALMGHDMDAEQIARKAMAIGVGLFDGLHQRQRDGGENRRMTLSANDYAPPMSVGTNHGSPGRHNSQLGGWPDARAPREETSPG